MCVYVREKQSQTITEKSVFKIFIYLFVFGRTGSSCCVGLSVAVTSGCCSLVVNSWASYCEANISPWAVDANVAEFFFSNFNFRSFRYTGERGLNGRKGSACPIVSFPSLLPMMASGHVQPLLSR